MLSYYIYKLITNLIRPFIAFYILIRMSKGKEDRSRIAERYGTSDVKRKEGKVIWLNGFGIINLSQVFSTHFFLKPIPTGSIDELLRREMLRIPSLTLWRGPLGPSGEIPIEIPFLRDFIIWRADVSPPLFLVLPDLWVDPLIALNPSFDINLAIISPSLCLEINTFISNSLCHVRGHIKS